ncbi:transcriptional regulator, AraC family [Tolumonas auensis DSM 9187]|uniref:Transcriptional regulator, AraC family n=1 Tax=Tolumonas auensis (strain DSM 9187 / NBRC 110442 / TA 4) TaxID=595494 RepID=C4LFY3_TOLAT|nr:AraC family transcriptional regulator [Tolumonas auensis]ACQ93500.1 transcriptional regulator, AraC family [Tolumonas auensis DSM 9187]
MKNKIDDFLINLINQEHIIDTVYYANDVGIPSEVAYQVHFPRLEFVIDGELPMKFALSNDENTIILQTKNTVLFIPNDGWNEPQWEKPVTTLSLLFGKQQLGFSLMQWDGSEFHLLEKCHIPRRGPRTAAFILQALMELTWRPEDQQTAILLIRSLISSSVDLMQHPAETLSRSKTLFETIRSYIEDNYQKELTRDLVAKEFYISPNYLSQLFQKEANMRFNEYLNFIRIERAKYLLKRYDLKVKEVAHRCGFNDSNYFCRLFKEKTDRSPSEYRVQYQSQQ